MMSTGDQWRVDEGHLPAELMIAEAPMPGAAEATDGGRRSGPTAGDLILPSH